MPAMDGQSISGCLRLCGSPIRWGPVRHPRRFCGCARRHVRHTLAGIPQRHSFPQNGVADQRTQRASNHHLYAPAQELLEVGNQAPRKPWRGVAGHVDQEVDVALRGIFSTSYGAEKQDIARAVKGGHPQDLVAMFSYALTGAHAFIVLSGRRGGQSVAIWDRVAPQSGRLYYPDPRVGTIMPSRRTIKPAPACRSPGPLRVIRYSALHFELWWRARHRRWVWFSSR
jgi:hypothetical protein